ncbi:MAG: hypothetical protein ACQSGP_03195 [Frankia sp.]
MTSAKWLDQVQRIERVRDDDLLGIEAGRSSRDLLAKLVAGQPEAVTAAPGERAAGTRGFGRTHHGRSVRRLRPLVAAGVILVLTAAAIIMTQVTHSPVAAAGVKVTRAGNDYIVEIIDPERDAKELTAGLREAGLNIHLYTLPVSPSLVGTIVYDDGGTGIRPLHQGACVTGGGGCPMGLRVSTNLHGPVYVAVGRQARPGERYESTTSAFAPGEMLHCDFVYGKRIGDVLASIHRRGVRISNEGSLPKNWYVNGTDPVSLNVVHMSVASAPPAPLPPAYETALNTGC